MSGSPGRLCNHIIRAHAAHFLAKKGNIRFCYGEYMSDMVRLGIILFTDGEDATSNYTVEYNETTFFRSIVSDHIPVRYNINLNTCYCQTREFSNYLYQYYRLLENQMPIIRANPYNRRYRCNNDVFIHVRLGDVESYNPGYSYYDTCLRAISFENGYLASDSLDHEICQKLIQTYSLRIVDTKEVDTIQFGSTCRHIVLSGGTFSYIIGLFAFYSTVYYPDDIGLWYPPELFSIPDWNKVTIQT